MIKLPRWTATQRGHSGLLFGVCGRLRHAGSQWNIQPCDGAVVVITLAGSNTTKDMALVRIRKSYDRAASQFLTLPISL